MYESQHFSRILQPIENLAVSNIAADYTWLGFVNFPKNQQLNFEEIIIRVYIKRSKYTWLAIVDKLVICIKIFSHLSNGE